MKQRGLSDPSRIQRALLTVSLVFATVALTYFGFTRKLPAIGLLIPIIGLASWLISVPLQTFFLMMLAYSCALRIPGFPSVLSVVVLCQFLMIGWTLLDRSIRHNKPRFSSEPQIDNWLALFTVNLVLIMFVRGAGFAIFGSSTYGGTGYIMFFLAISSYYTVSRLRMSDSDVKKLLLILLAGTTLAMGVQVLSYYSGGFDWMQKFISVDTEGLVQEEEVRREDAVLRWATLGKVAYALIPIAYVLCRKKITRVILIVAAFVMVGMTGSRSHLIGVAMLVFLSVIYHSRSRVRTVLLWGMVGVVALGFLMVAAPVLPRAIQRTVSFIEFIPVDPDIALRAEGSSDWRFDMWRDYCIPRIPEYLLIGRGIAHDITGFAWLNWKWYGSAEFFYYMGRYHSGPFSLILDHGLPGTIGFTIFFLLTLSDGWKTVRRYASKQDTLTSRYYIYLTILMTYEVFNFYFIFGSPVSGMFRMLMVAAQMRILKKNFLMESPLEGGVQTPDRLVESVKPAETLSAPGRSAFGGKPAGAVNRWAVRRPGARG